MAVLRNAVNYIELDTDKYWTKMQNALEHSIRKYSMHVNQPSCFEGAAKKIYLFLYGHPPKIYLSHV